jgi:hypothetical protein
MGFVRRPRQYCIRYWYGPATHTAQTLLQRHRGPWQQASGVQIAQQTRRILGTGNPPHAKE